MYTTPFVRRAYLMHSPDGCEVNQDPVEGRVAPMRVTLSFARLGWRAAGTSQYPTLRSRGTFPTRYVFVNPMGRATNGCLEP